MTKPALASFLSSATEIAWALGLVDQLVNIAHDLFQGSAHRQRVKGWRPSSLISRVIPASIFLEESTVNISTDMISPFDQSKPGSHRYLMVWNGKERENPNISSVAATLEKAITYVFAESPFRNEVGDSILADFVFTISG